MKRIIVFIFLVVLFSSMVNAGLEAISEANSPQITATLQSQSPDPVEPGEILTVKFKIENGAKQTSDDVIVRILPKFPFELYGDAAERNLGKMKAVSTGADAHVVEYKLKVDEDAAEGEVEIELEIEVGDIKIGYIEDELLIDVETRDAVLEITSITTDPEQISPGETADLRVTVKNLADSLLRDIKFTLDFKDDTFPLAPYQSTSQRKIQQLQTGNQLPLNFQVIADPAATSGLYKIPLNISYNDEKGNEYTMADVIAVLIGDEPDVQAYIKKSTVLQADSPGKVTIEIANAGTNDVKFLELTLLPSKDFDLITTSNYVYIGDVDSDDTESEEFNIFVHRRVKELSLPVELKYTDANNKESVETFDLKLQLYSSRTLKKFGVIESSSAGVYFFLLIVIVGGVYLYRLRKKDPEKYARLKKKVMFWNKKK